MFDNVLVEVSDAKKIMVRASSKAQAKRKIAAVKGARTRKANKIAAKTPVTQVKKAASKKKVIKEPLKTAKTKKATGTARGKGVGKGSPGKPKSQAHKDAISAAAKKRWASIKKSAKKGGGSVSGVKKTVKQVSKAKVTKPTAAAKKLTAAQAKKQPRSVLSKKETAVKKAKSQRPKATKSHATTATAYAAFVKKTAGRKNSRAKVTKAEWVKQRKAGIAHPLGKRA